MTSVAAQAFIALGQARCTRPKADIRPVPQRCSAASPQQTFDVQNALTLGGKSLLV